MTQHKFSVSWENRSKETKLLKTLDGNNSRALMILTHEKQQFITEKVAATNHMLAIKY